MLSLIRGRLVNQGMNYDEAKKLASPENILELLECHLIAEDADFNSLTIQDKQRMRTMLAESGQEVTMEELEELIEASNKIKNLWKE